MTERMLEDLRLRSQVIVDRKIELQKKLNQIAEILGNFSMEQNVIFLKQILEIERAGKELIDEINDLLDAVSMVRNAHSRRKKENIYVT